MTNKSNTRTRNTNNTQTPVVLFNPFTQRSLAFESIADAAAHLGTDESNVRRVVNRQRNRTSVCGHFASRLEWTRI